MSNEGEPGGSTLQPSTPTSARAYGWMLGGKDNFEVDRQFILNTVQAFPECVDIARQNREFLFRVVRHLVRDAGVRQFIDLGCGLPTHNNVHQVAQQFDEGATVVYVDADPIVLSHGRALLESDDRTTVISADFREPGAVLDHPDTRRLIDFSAPVAILFLSVGHHVKDSDDVGHGARHALRHILEQVAVPGSYLAFSQVVIEDPAKAAQMSADIDGAGIPWQTRTPTEVDALFDGLERVEPGLGNVRHWRPDPSQPPLDPVPPPLHPYVGVTDRSTDVYEYGGLLRRP